MSPSERAATRASSWTGEYRAWRRCGGTDTAIVAVAAETDGGDTVVVLAQLLGPADLAALDATLASINVT